MNTLLPRSVPWTVLVICVPGLVGCDDSPKERLAGRWVGERIEAFAPAQAERALGWARDAFFEFKGSQVTVGIPAERPRTGTFEVAQAEENALSLVFRRPQGTTDRVAMRFEGDDRLRWMLPDGRSIVLRRDVE
ncbi:MAG: hypothetical protein AAGN82_21840 [Myxococcota bacterium]